MEEIGTQLENFNTLVGQVVTFMPLAAILLLAFWQGYLFLYVLCVPACTVYGLSLAAGEANGSALWVAGIVIAIIGTYCLFKVVRMGFEEVKARRK